MALNIISKNHGRYNYSLTTDILKNIDPYRKFKRASIIPYYIHNNVPHYALFLDARFRQITDCGGTTKGRNYLYVALKELKEESVGVFDYTGLIKSMDNCKCYYDHERIVIFVRENNPNIFNYGVQFFFTKYTDKIKNMIFSNSMINYDELENISMMWISEPNLKLLCEDEKVANGKNLHINKFIDVTSSNMNYFIKLFISNRNMDGILIDSYNVKVQVNSNLDYNNKIVIKSKLTPYSYFKIYIKPHSKNDSIMYPDIWDPVKYFFKTLFDVKGNII